MTPTKKPSSRPEGEIVRAIREQMEKLQQDYKRFAKSNADMGFYISAAECTFAVKGVDHCLRIVEEASQRQRQSRPGKKERGDWRGDEHKRCIDTAMSKLWVVG